MGIRDSCGRDDNVVISARTLLILVDGAQRTYQGSLSGGIGARTLALNGGHLGNTGHITFSQGTAEHSKQLK